MSEGSRILVARTDRLGDVMMTVPTLEYLRMAMPEAEIDFLVSPAYAELLGPYLESRNIHAVRAVAGGYDAALLLHAELKVMIELLFARVPVRVGPLSKPASWFFFNRGERQRRSEGTMNEGEYNLALARRLVREVTGRTVEEVPPKVTLPSDEESRREAAALVGEGGYAVLHPGTGGSGLNVSAAKYSELIAKIEKVFGVPVMLSEGPSPIDKALVGEISALRPGIRALRGMRLGVLREVFRGAKVVAGPSTGPLHMAHYVGARTISLFAPVWSQRKERWGHWGGSGEALILQPDVDCPGARQCIGKACSNYFCMERMPHDLRGAECSSS